MSIPPDQLTYKHPTGAPATTAETMRCQNCWALLTPARRGPQPVTCSPRCRQAFTGTKNNNRPAKPPPRTRPFQVEPKQTAAHARRSNERQRLMDRLRSDNDHDLATQLEKMWRTNPAHLHELRRSKDSREAVRETLVPRMRLLYRRCPRRQIPRCGRTIPMAPFFDPNDPQHAHTRRIADDQSPLGKTPTTQTDHRKGEVRYRRMGGYEQGRRLAPAPTRAPGLPLAITARAGTAETRISPSKGAQMPRGRRRIAPALVRHRRPGQRIHTHPAGRSESPRRSPEIQRKGLRTLSNPPSLQDR